MLGEQSWTIAAASRWLKALKRRSTSSAQLASSIAVPVRGDDSHRRDVLSAGDPRQSKDGDVVLGSRSGEGAQRGFDSLHGANWAGSAADLGPQPLLAEAPSLASRLDDSV